MVQYTPLGLAWSNAWGSLRFTANAALIAVVYAKHIKGECIHDAAVENGFIWSVLWLVVRQRHRAIALVYAKQIPSDGC